MTVAQEITEDTLTASLAQLLKAAGATDALRKGGIVNSGFEDEDGKQGGGQAGKSDAGGIEELMIGKLVASGMDAAAAGEIVGLLSEGGLLGHKKEESEEEEKEEKEEGGDEEDEDMRGYARGYADAMAKMGKSETAAPAGEELAKSIQKSFSTDKDIAEGVNATPFLEALVARTTESFGALAKSIAANDKKQVEVNIALAKAVHQLGGLMKSNARVSDELGKRLGIVERQPATTPKGARTLQGAQALKKSQEGGGELLLKSGDMAAALSYLRFVKSMDTIEGESTGQAAVMAEAGGVVSPAVKEYVGKWLAANPGERQAALGYH